MSGSVASRSSAGSTPTVESVMRRGLTREAVLVGEDPQRLHRRVVVVQRLAHAHQHDVEARLRACRARARARAPGRRSRRRSGCGSMPILPVRQKPQFIAQPTCVEMQNVLRRRVGDEDRLDQLAVREPQQELRRAVVETFLRGRRRACAIAEARGRAATRSSRPRSVISREVGDAALVDPLEDLPRVEARMPERLERLLELGELEFGDVDGWSACVRHIAGESIDYPRRRAAADARSSSDGCSALSRLPAIRVRTTCGA